MTVSAINILYPFSLMSMRLSLLILHSPIHIFRLLPFRARTMIWLGLTGFLYIALHPQLLMPSIPLVITAFLYETFNSFILSFGLTLIMGACHWMGTLIDTQIGLNVMGILNPAQGSTDGFHAYLLPILLLLFFLNGNGLYECIDFALASFIKTSPGHLLLIDDIHLYIKSILFLIIHLLWFIVPLIGSMCLIDMTSAILTRNMPQISPYFFTTPVKIIAGLFLSFESLKPMNHLIQRISHG